MNNTKYSDAVKFDSNRTVKYFQIDYIREVKHEDLLHIKTFNSDNELKVEGICADNVSFKALFHYE